MADDTNALQNEEIQHLLERAEAAGFLESTDLSDVLDTLELDAADVELVVPARGVIHYGAHVGEHGEAFYEAASEQRVEGIVAKRAASVYGAGRSSDWLKIKCHLRQEFVIGGFTEPQGSRARFGALHLGVYDSDDLVYVGRALVYVSLIFSLVSAFSYARLFAEAVEAKNSRSASNTSPGPPGS